MISIIAVAVDFHGFILKRTYSFERKGLMAVRTPLKSNHLTSVGECKLVELKADLKAEGRAKKTPKDLEILF